MVLFYYWLTSRHFCWSSFIYSRFVWEKFHHLIKNHCISHLILILSIHCKFPIDCKHFQCIKTYIYRCFSSLHFVCATGVTFTAWYKFKDSIIESNYPMLLERRLVPVFYWICYPIANESSDIERTNNLFLFICFRVQGEIFIRSIFTKKSDIRYANFQHKSSIFEWTWKCLIEIKINVREHVYPKQITNIR